MNIKNFQDNWQCLLPLAMFPNNNALSATTKYSPFNANYSINIYFNGTNIGLALARSSTFNKEIPTALV
jgi:hypothetical protein